MWYFLIDIAIGFIRLLVTSVSLRIKYQSSLIRSIITPSQPPVGNLLTFLIVNGLEEEHIFWCMLTRIYIPIWLCIQVLFAFVLFNKPTQSWNIFLKVANLLCWTLIRIWSIIVKYLFRVCYLLFILQFSSFISGIFPSFSCFTPSKSI